MGFSKRLIALREQKGLTQEGLAKALNISRSALSLWELGKREPGHATLQRLADYFGVSVDYLLGRTDDPRPSGKSTDESQDLLPELDDMLKQVPGGLTEEERESLLRHNRVALKLIEEERQRRKEGKTDN